MLFLVRKAQTENENENKKDISNEMRTETMKLLFCFEDLVKSNKSFELLDRWINITENKDLRDSMII